MAESRNASTLSATSPAEVFEWLQGKFLERAELAATGQAGEDASGKLYGSVQRWFTPAGEMIYMMYWGKLIDVALPDGSHYRFWPDDFEPLSDDTSADLNDVVGSLSKPFDDALPLGMEGSTFGLLDDTGLVLAMVHYRHEVSPSIYSLTDRPVPSELVRLSLADFWSLVDSGRMVCTDDLITGLDQPVYDIDNIPRFQQFDVWLGSERLSGVSLIPNAVYGLYPDGVNVPVEEDPSYDYPHTFTADEVERLDEDDNRIVDLRPRVGYVIDRRFRLIKPE